MPQRRSRRTAMICVPLQRRIARTRGVVEHGNKSRTGSVGSDTSTQRGYATSHRLHHYGSGMSYDPVMMAPYTMTRPIKPLRRLVEEDTNANKPRIHPSRSTLLDTQHALQDHRTRPRHQRIRSNPSPKRRLDLVRHRLQQRLQRISMSLLLQRLRTRWSLRPTSLRCGILLWHQPPGWIQVLRRGWHRCTG